MNYSNPLDAVPDVSLETRLIITENQCDGISSTLLIMGVWTTTRAVTGDLDAHTPCKYPASPVPIPGVHIEVVHGTRGCPGVNGRGTLC